MTFPTYDKYGFTFRSKAEVRFADLLVGEDITFNVEPLLHIDADLITNKLDKVMVSHLIRDNQLQYRPDFYLDDANLVVEIKHQTAPLSPVEEAKYRIFGEYFASQGVRFIVLNLGWDRQPTEVLMEFGDFTNISGEVLDVILSYKTTSTRIIGRVVKFKLPEQVNEKRVGINDQFNHQYKNKQKFKKR